MHSFGVCVYGLAEFACQKYIVRIIENCLAALCPTQFPMISVPRTFNAFGDFIALFVQIVRYEIEN